MWLPLNLCTIFISLSLSNCAVIEPGMLNYLPGQLTLWGPDGSSTDNLRSKGRAQVHATIVPLMFECETKVLLLVCS